MNEIKAVFQDSAVPTQRIAEITQRLVETTVRLTRVWTPQSVAAPIGGLTEVVLDREFPKRVELELIKHIRPIAPVVVRSAAKKAFSISQLVETVSREIEDDAVRIRFVKRFANADSSTPVSQPSHPSAPSQIATKSAENRFDTAVLSKAEAALSQYLGPLARVVVKRAANRARDETETLLVDRR